MDCGELYIRIKKGEDSKTQFKERFNSVNALAAEMAAFANSEGGEIFVGVSDVGEITGLSRDEIRKLNQWISNACSQKIEPPMGVITENILCEGKVIVRISVPLGQNKPYAVNKTDFWIKVGADKRRATREELRRLMQTSGNFYADEMRIMGSNIDDMNLPLFKDFYRKVFYVDIDESGMATEKILHNLKLMEKDALTLSGLLLFGYSPQRFKSQFLVKAVSFFGNELSGKEYRDSEDIGGTILDQYRNGMAFLKRNLRKVQKEKHFDSTGTLEIPEVALEEVVVNALIHRDYFIESSIKFFIFDDRVEIISPGRLPNTVNIDNIKEGVSIARNPILLSFVAKFASLNMIPYRGIGSGIKRMIRECDKAKVKFDLVEDRSKEEFRVVFYRKDDHSK